ncbi:MAG: caspase family protein, partial [bacterium]|nr:caspase family protein [bacterium]
MTRSLISQNSVLLWICCSVVLTTSAVTLAAEKPPFQSGLRVALLVGNRDYDGVKLPQVDASLNAVESTLQDMGFTIDRRTNLDQKAIQLAFDETHGNAPTNSVLVIYYIGLSGCVRRNNQFENLLRPVGVKIENENDYRSSGLNLNKTLQPKSTETGARTTLVFLDCCWQSPIAPNSDNFKSGLASFKHPTD